MLGSAGYKLRGVLGSARFELRSLFGSAGYKLHGVLGSAGFKLRGVLGSGGYKLRGVLVSAGYKLRGVLGTKSPTQKLDSCCFAAIHICTSKFISTPWAENVPFSCMSQKPQPLCWCRGANSCCVHTTALVQIVSYRCNIKEAIK